MRPKRLVLFASAIVAVAIAPAAAAQGDTGDSPPASQWAPASGVGLAIMAGGGATDFTSTITRGETRTGPSWTVRVAFGTRSLVGVEASYVGGANTIGGLGASNASLVRDGVEAVLRINGPLYARGTLFEPYIFGGAGWNGYRVTTSPSAVASASPAGTTDSTLSVPLGAGFSVGHRGFVADVRCTIRPTYEQSILQNQSSGALTNWDAGAMLGYEL